MRHFVLQVSRITIMCYLYFIIYNLWFKFSESGNLDYCDIPKCKSKPTAPTPNFFGGFEIASLVTEKPASLDNVFTEIVTCKEFEFKCISNNECTHVNNLCDDIPHCRDGTDEHPETCSRSLQVR